MKKIMCGVALGLGIGLTVSAFGEELTQYLAEKANFPILINGQEFKTDKPIVTIEGSTYMPLRAIGEALGVEINWNSDLNRVEIGEVPKDDNYSYSNPAPIGETQKFKYESFTEQYTAEVTIKEVIRGAEAWAKIKAANAFNKEAKEGQEYILAKINFKLVDMEDDKALSVNSTKINLVSREGKEYPYFIGAVPPDPQFNANLYKGASIEGWEVYVVDKTDATPKFCAGRNYDGSGGVWFKAYE